MNEASYVFALLVATALALLLPAAFIVYVDPYQAFHRPFFSGMGLPDNQRYVNAGLINFPRGQTAGHDAVLVGSSLSENFTTADVRASLHWAKPLRLFMHGANPRELSVTVRHALEDPTVRHVLWELRPRTHSLREDEFPPDRRVFPEYLYNHDLYDNAPYVFNRDILRVSWHVWRGDLSVFNLTPESLGYWGDAKPVSEQRDRFNAAENLADFSRQQADFSMDLARVSHPAPYPAFDQYVFPVLDRYCNAGIEFVLFVPPVSKLEYRSNSMLAERSVAMLRYVLKRTQQCGNIRLHAFDLMDFSNDLSNYKDTEHYMPPINKRLLELMGRREQVLTLDNIDDYERALVNALNEYRVTSSGR